MGYVDGQLGLLQLSNVCAILIGVIASLVRVSWWLDWGFPAVEGRKRGSSGTGRPVITPLGRNRRSVFRWRCWGLIKLKS
jgi:hypothetical protein